MSSAQDTFDAQCEDKNCDVPRGHDGDHSDGIECWPRETKATFRDKWTEARAAWYSEAPSYTPLMETGDEMVREIERLQAERDRIQAWLKEPTTRIIPYEFYEDETWARRAWFDGANKMLEAIKAVLNAE